MWERRAEPTVRPTVKRRAHRRWIHIYIGGGASEHTYIYDTLLLFRWGTGHLECPRGTNDRTEIGCKSKWREGIKKWRVPQRPSYSGIGRKRTHRKSRLTKIGGEVKQRIGYKGGLSLDTRDRRSGVSVVSACVPEQPACCYQLVF